MNFLQSLVEQAGSGEPGRFEALVDAVRARGGADVGFLLACAGAAEGLLRQAFIAAVREQNTPEILEMLSGLASDPDEEVRRYLAEAIGRALYWPLDEALGRLLHDESEAVRMAAVRAARGRPAFETALAQRLGQDPDWRTRQLIAGVLVDAEARVALPALIAALGQDADRDVSGACADTIESHLILHGGFPQEADRPGLPVLEEAQRRLVALGADRFPFLREWLAECVAHDVDLDKLRTFGTLLSLEAEAGKLPRSHGRDAVCATVRGLLLGNAPRAVVLLGEAGTGKTAVVQEMVHRLRNDPDGPWHVLRVSPSELLAGTMYLGEWQTKVRDLVQAVRAPRRVILYVPNLEELSRAGQSAKSDSNIGSALAPHIEHGEVVVLGESTPEAYQSGLGGVESLRRLFHAVEVRAANPEETRLILRQVCGELAVEVPEAVLERIQELADFYLAGTAEPGRSVGLLRRVLSATAGRAGPVTARDALLTLSTATGIPVDYLDDSVPLVKDRVRAFFESRVMGQPDAVEAVLERVALVKAGLTDPNKPFGVLFFIGPTGVGKTELARALAELLFGDPGRLIRLDMSEFATYEAYERLLGWSGKPGLLTGAVRERPFSVLLLDEIEKAHPNVFDLCLQLFDAGRLTDMQGRTTDFRRTLIVLTSNLGSALLDESGFGFQKQSSGPVHDPGSALRELDRWFRPEFLNRLDRIVTFQPLSADTVEQIARREVGRVLERSGIARRRLAVDVDATVLALLLKEGYSPAYGARPLKRTVERLVLLPVAWAIAAGDVPAGALLRLVARGGRVNVEVIVPEPEEGAPLPAATRTTPIGDRAAALAERLAGMQEQAAPLAARKAELLARLAEPGIHADGAASRRVSDEIYRLDGVLEKLQNLVRDVNDQADRARRQRHSVRDLARIEQKLEGLESQTEQVAFLVTCRERRDLGDAYVVLTQIQALGAGLDAVGMLARMYKALARRRGFECEVLDDHAGGSGQENSLCLCLAGVGAHALLAGETGLHQLGQGKSKGQKRNDGQPPRERVVVRVEVLPVPPDDVAFATEELRIETRPLENVRGRLLPNPDLDVQIVHRPSLLSVRAWTRGPRARAVKQLLPLLRSRLDAAEAHDQAGAAQKLIRRYTLGPTPKVFDLRTGRATGRLDLVLKGHLDSLRLLSARNA